MPFERFAHKVLSSVNVDHINLNQEFWRTPEQNPWFGFRLEDGQNTFVLPDDNEAIAHYNNGKNENDETYIHLDAPPQPFTGNPDAPIWLLLMNPSYDVMDIFDLVNEEKGLQQIRTGVNQDIIATRGGYFETRRALMENQYSFHFQLDNKRYDCPWFYLLDESFHTVFKQKGNARHGGYDWWKRYLLSQNICNGDKENLRKFFVLESFPYHSLEFGKIRQIGPWNLAKKHCEFWVKMVAAALNGNKILLCRGIEIAERVCEIADLMRKLFQLDLTTDNIYINVDKNGRGAQNFNVGRKNFMPYCKLVKRDEKAPDALTNELINRGIITVDDE